MPDEYDPTKAAITVIHKTKKMAQPMANQISMALAQFALFGFSLDPKAQTKSIIKPTIGMKLISRVITQSLVLNTFVC